MRKTILSIIIMLLTVVGASAQSNIAQGEVGTCQWYITGDSTLVIAPKDGAVSGDLPKNGWDSNNITTAPWGTYFSSISSAKIMSGVNAQSCRNMFRGLYKLEAIDLSGFNTENVTDMGSMFYGCSSLTTLDLSNLNTQNVMNMMLMFSGCFSLTLLDLSNFNMQNVTNMSGMFADCSALFTIISNNENPSPLQAGIFEFFKNRANCTLIVPIGTKELYAAAAGWNELGKISEATSDIPVIPSNAIAGGEEGTCIWYITSEGELVIAPANGISGSLPVSGWFTTSPPWCEHKDSIYSAKIIPGVNTMSCGYMFYGLSKMETIDLSNFNTQNVTDMYNMFRGCSSLTSLDLSSFNTQNVTITSYMFTDCSSLTSLDLSNFNTENVMNMSDMFYGCSSLTSLDLSNFNTENVTNMSDMFYGCSSLTSLDLSKFDTQNVRDMSWMFYGCSSLTSLDLSSFNTENVTNMSDMFFGCSSLTSLDLSNFNTRNVRGDSLKGGMAYMFYGCSSLTSLDLSNFNTQNVTSMLSMFEGCSSLTSLDISSCNTQNVTIMSYMFTDCYSLTSLDLSNFNTQNVTSMRDMFRSCQFISTIISNNETPSPLQVGTFSSLKSRAKCTLLVPTGSVALYAAADGWNELGNITDELPNDSTGHNYLVWGETGTCQWYITNDKTLVIAPMDGNESGDLPESGWDYNTPWEEYNENILAAIVMPGVNATSCSYMFNRLKKMTSIDLSGLTTRNVTSMVAMFSGCSALASLDLSNFNTENVTNMTYMFYGCSSLTSLDISNFNTQNVTSMYGIFSGCSSLTSLDLSNFNTQKMTSMSSMFLGCSSLTTLDVSNFNTQNVTSMDYMFVDCSSLTSLDLSNFDTQNVTFMMQMFDGCSSLTALDLSNFDTQNVTNMTWIFNNCSSLKSINLSNFNTQKLAVTEKMFSGCSALTTIITDNIIPSPLKVGTFITFELRDNCTLHVPAGSKARFAAADGWNELVNIIDDREGYDFPKGSSAIGEIGTCVWYIDAENTLVIAPRNDESGILPECGNDLSAETPWIEYIDNILAVKIMHGVNAESCYRMFCDFKNMTSADLSGLSTQNVTDMSYMFYGCSSLTSLDLSGFNMLNVTDMSSMFDQCSSLISIISDRRVPSALQVGAFKSLENRAYCTLLVPAGTKTLYAAAEGWKELGNIKEQIKDVYGTPVLVLTSEKTFYNSGNYMVERVTYTRNFTKQTPKGGNAGWETIVLPFNVQRIASAKGQLLAPFGSFEAESGIALPFWLAEYTEDGSFKHATSIRANIPYIIAMPNSDDYNQKYCVSGTVTFAAQNVEIHKSEDAVSVEGNGYTFTPTYNFVEPAHNIFAINHESYSSESLFLPGSIFLEESSTVKPFEAYLSVPEYEQPYAANRRYVRIVTDSNVADGIYEVLTGNDAANGKFLQNGKLIIRKNGAKFNATGVQMK